MPLGYGNFQILLIDVEGMQIVQESSLTRYLAFNYIWGKGDMFKTTKSNISQLQKKNALLLHSIPIAILDAIRLTHKLGEKYPCVDFLYIIQDDANHKYEQIRMDLIYGNAELTIAAFSRETVHSPLPGVSHERLAPIRSEEIFGRCSSALSPNPVSMGLYPTYQ